MSETTLWTNSSPTSAFSAQTVTVSNMSSYDLIKIEGIVSTSEQTTIEAYYTLNYLKSCALNTSSVIHAMATITGKGKSAGRYIRAFWAPSNTQIEFSTGTQVYGSASSTSRSIPTSIKGIKF